MKEKEISVTEALKRMRALVNSDPENAHIEADEILCEIAEACGYGEVVEAYRKIDKWYA